ncbi:MAG: cadherin-like domain-containing protein [Cypionkella sp.]
MTISVKTAKAQDSNADTSDPYAPKLQKPRSSLPMAIGTAVISIALYIKSMVTSIAHVSGASPDVAHPTKEHPLSSVGSDADLAAAGQDQPDPARADASLPDDSKSVKFLGNTIHRPMRTDWYTSAPMAKHDNVFELFPKKLPGLRSFTENDEQGFVLSGANANIKIPTARPENLSSTAVAKDHTQDPPLAPSPAKVNHAPIKTRSVYLADIASGDALFISIAGLLAFTTDVDGDTLTVRNLQVSSGQLHLAAEGYLFLPDPEAIGPVQISYEITDGQYSLAQMAHLTVYAQPETAADLTGIMFGSDGDDDLSGSQVNGVILSGDGADHVQGGIGNEVISGGAGDDILSGGAGNDMIFGGDGNDLLKGEAGNDHLYGGNGTDTLDGGIGDDQLSGGAGDDVLLDSAGSDTITGDSGRDTVIAALDGANDVFSGGSEAQTPAAGQNLAIEIHQTLHHKEICPGDQSSADGTSAEAADPRVMSDQAVALTEEDTLDYSAATLSLTIDLVTGKIESAEVGTDSIEGFEVVIAGSGDDLFILGTTGYVLSGGEGNDRFNFVATQTAEHFGIASFQIMDFRPGDVVETLKFEVHEAPESVDPGLLDVADQELTDMGSLSKFHISFEGLDAEACTVLTLDDSDDQLAGIVTFHGHHILVFHELA